MKMIKVNKADISEEELNNLQADEEEEEGSFFDIFTSRILFVRSMIIFFNWWVET